MIDSLIEGIWTKEYKRQLCEFYGVDGVAAVEDFLILLHEHKAIPPTLFDPNRHCDAERVIAWIDDSDRKPANMAFTAGLERQIAYRFEDQTLRNTSIETLSNLGDDEHKVHKGSEISVAEKLDPSKHCVMECEICGAEWYWKKDGDEKHECKAAEQPVRATDNEDAHMAAHSAYWSAIDDRKEHPDTAVDEAIETYLQHTTRESSEEDQADFKSLLSALLFHVYGKDENTDPRPFDSAASDMAAGILDHFDIRRKSSEDKV